MDEQQLEARRRRSREAQRRWRAKKRLQQPAAESGETAKSSRFDQLTKEDIAWVAASLDAGRQVSQPPSPAASGCLKWVESDEGNASKFWTAMIAAANKGKQEEGNAQKDDERRIFKILDDLERERPQFYRNRVAIDPIEAGRVPAVPTVPLATSQAQVQA